MQKSMSLKYEPSSEQLRIPARRVEDVEVYACRLVTALGLTLLS